ncbi:asparagine synthase (glutamine-hydrolyzing) [Polynucleobacter sp. MWH-Loch1C5]|uniref:asparagine synthase (glutamine-hydrolyzing) n=1 Tax=Polynucleobacter sp. MWH-Loch1C5 TaxID=2689108 RepID=UPI001C0C6115|nr:asparagine synthase (glutamine-hydrolyzing) [Polynucleobacter sp. MWH-Loch1C5]MBU3542202.1 asparagine synthase (glutamine-hydrolyzing) [Polynucleobacter sp. MWH-Loch1C5]
MCGIVGAGGAAPLQNRSWLAVGRDLMTHRGPDDAGEWWSDDGRVGLAQRRLSIVDLSPAGHQPMHDASGMISIVFNGEIYNFRELRDELIARGHGFRTNSDTEVILEAYRAWGTECLGRLNGMFAFAIYDARKSELLLARDRAGEKPLFYYLKSGELRFASELKALLADHTVPRRIASEALDCYLAMGYVPGERCMLQGFNKLPPAHGLLFDLQTGHSKVWRYWQLPEFLVADHSLDEDALLDELEALIEDAVRRQMVADVPLGVLLSGGVDSSLITAMAVRSSSRIRTFTIGFPGHDKLDETKHAELIAQYFGTQHTVLMAEAATADLLPRLARQFDEPIVDSSMIPTFLVSQMVREHCTIALGGDGGDELFGGYSHYSQILGMRERLSGIPLSLRTSIANAAEKILPVGLKGRNWLQGLGYDLRKGLPLQSLCFDEITRRNLFSKDANWEPKAASIFKRLCPNQADLLQRATRMDFQNYLAEDILVKVDRASMLNSLEMRAPFLDYRLVEFAFGKVPSRLKANTNDKKILLKRLTARVLPADFDRQRKQGFSIPLNEWLKSGTFRELFNDVLLDPKSIFNSRVAASLLMGIDKGRKNGERLFALVMFELWRREYDISAS